MKRVFSSPFIDGFILYAASSLLGMRLGGPVMLFLWSAFVIGQLARGRVYFGYFGDTPLLAVSVAVSLGVNALGLGLMIYGGLRAAVQAKRMLSGVRNSEGPK